jgi:hypothetical protein
MRRRKPHIDVSRLELLEEAADHFSIQDRRGRIREDAGQPAKTAHDIALEAIIAERLTPAELELVHAIARGDAHPPYPPRRYPDESPTILRDMAHVLVRDSDEVVTLEERRRKRESDATR